ncbi:MAG: colanic acid biosynthesis glycosyltransferase WcaI, partial [Anaerolinea sp.]|nr:colanic acid biosynthesis glycosyltransferase WcaI [Anaerolinea sp.]
MRILISGLNFAPELTGIGKYTGGLTEYLAAAGHAVRVVTAPPYYPQWEVAPGYSSRCYQKENWKDIDVYRCPLWVPRKQSGFNRILHLMSFALSSAPVMLTQIAWKPDLVFCVAPALMCAPVALIVARIAKSKSWLHIQDFELDAAFGFGMLSGEKFFYPFARCVETAIYRRFDRMSTISNRMLERLQQKGVSKEHTVFLPNWIDTETITPLAGPSPYREELGLSNDQIVILYS